MAWAQSNTAEDPYLHYKNFVSGVAPDLELLIVPLSILCNAHRTHLREERRENAQVSPRCFTQTSETLPRTRPTQAYTEGVLEAVGRRLLVALPVLLPPLAEEESLLVQEQVPLHGLEPSQVLDLGVTFLVLRPHTEGALHQQAAQVWQIALNSEETGIYDQVWKPVTPVKKMFLQVFPAQASYLISCDGDEVHWVVDSFQDPQDGGKRFL